MTAVEEFCAHHAETVEDIMYRWPWRRFEGMFKRHLLRKAREEMRQMRDLRLAALDSNSNFDSEENRQAKQSRVDGLQQAFQDAEKMLYSDHAPIVEQDDYGDDPLFDPIRRRAAATQPLVKQAGMGRQLIDVQS